MAMCMFIGLLCFMEGEVMVVGYDVYCEFEQIKCCIGYMSQKFLFYEDLKVWENICFYGGIYGLFCKQVWQEVDWLIEEFGMLEFVNSLVFGILLGWW